MRSAEGLREWPQHVDDRGALVALEAGDAVPFPIARVFVIRDIPPAGARRGGHAHHACHELVVALEGRVVLTLDDGGGPRRIELDRATRGVHVPPMTWIDLDLDAGAVVMVLCSHRFDEADYIRDADAWRALRPR